MVGEVVSEPACSAVNVRERQKFGKAAVNGGGEYQWFAAFKIFVRGKLFLKETLKKTRCAAALFGFTEGSYPHEAGTSGE